jgi:hypothetical protein
LEGTLKKLAFVASAAVALICAASLVATPADAKKRHHAKKPAAATTQMAAGPGGYNAGPSHQPGGPMKSGNLCWSDKDAWANTGQGYWKPCPKK